MTTGTAQTPLHEQVQSFVRTSRKMLIGGRWLDAASGKTFATYNPATGDMLTQVAEGDRTDVNKAVAAARAAFENGPWRKLTASERGRLIWKLADLLESHAEEFAQLESLDNGKPVGVARVADIPLAIDLLIEQINESHKHGVVLSRKIKRELTETLRVALNHAGRERLRETQKALDAFEKKVRAQVAKIEPEAAAAWIRWSQAVSEGMEKCIKPPRKSKDHDDRK